MFPPEPVVSAQTSSAIAKTLAAKGRKVTVLTSFPTRPGGKLFPGYKMRLYQKERAPEGFEVIRCFSFPSNQSTLFSRFLENISFGLTSALYLLFISGPCVIYSNTWAIFATGLMSLVARIRGFPYIIRVVDLYPESIISQKRQGLGKNLISLMRMIDQWIAKGAKQVAVLTKSFYDIYKGDRRIPEDRIKIIADWVEGSLEVTCAHEIEAVRERFNIGEDDFLAVYGGNIGVAAGVETLIEASKQLPDCKILIAGDGSELRSCQKLAQTAAPDRIFFWSPWPKEQTMPVYKAADVLILPTRGSQSLASIPSKLIRYMFSGRPMVATGLLGSELERIVNELGCGWVVPPDDPKELAIAIHEAINAGCEERNHRGCAGREFASSFFTTEKNLNRIIRLIENVG